MKPTETKDYLQKIQDDMADEVMARLLMVEGKMSQLKDSGDGIIVLSQSTKEAIKKHVEKINALFVEIAIAKEPDDEKT